MIDLTQIILAVIGLVSMVLTGFVLPLLRSKLTAQQQETLFALVRTGVFAAEQLFPLEKTGAEKLAYVKEYLNGLGYDADAVEVRAAIEAAVKELKIEIGK